MTTSELIPWDVRPEHRDEDDYIALRLEERRRRGESLTADEKATIQGFLLGLRDNDAIVAYAPGTPMGFVWIHRRPEHGDALVQREEIRPDGQ